MPLEAGNKLGPYEIIEQAGAGGMGEVYKANDSRLDRTVAIKILPPILAGNADLKQRFEREAKAISSLNHPFICTLYDVGQDNGHDYLVMEYLEGETLSERLQKGSLPIEELMQVAIQIADALDSAHRKGLIHRDLKPGNVMLTKDGAKLMDFGLAKLNLDSTLGDNVTNITMTSPLTGVGTILGTMQYMSPEQLEGKEADARSDIFAFGTMLYEMTTGKRAFEGSSQATLIAAIIEREPASVTTFKPMTPPGLERLIKKCMSKDADSRWQSVRDLSDELRWIMQSGSKAGIPIQVSVRRRFKMRMAWMVAAIAIVTSLYLGFVLFMQPKEEIQVARFTMVNIQGLQNITWPRISPDGKMIAFNADDSLGNDFIWIRPLSSLEAYPLLGTNNANRHYWSPDSKHIAFFSGTQLKKIPVAGGQSQLICEGAQGSDCSWGTSDIIIFDGNLGDSMRMVSADGGLVTGVTSLDSTSGDIYHAWPWFLPDGDHFLFIANSRDSARQGVTKLYVGSLSNKDKKFLTTLKLEGRIEYSHNGYILFIQDNNLMAMPFDDKSLEIIGEPRPIAQKIGLTRNAPVFGTSHNGILLYESNSSTATSQIVWVDREGKLIETVGQQGNYRDIALSPDESMFAYSFLDIQLSTTDIWLYDFKRNVPSRLTFEASNEGWPVWLPSGDEVAYIHNEGGSGKIMGKKINGLSEPTLIHKNDSATVAASDFTPDGNKVIFGEYASSTNIGILNLNDSNRVDMLTNSSFFEAFGTVSPNGKYVSYTSSESGRAEIYVRQLEGSGSKWQISKDGASRSQWRADGKELFFLSGDDIMAVDVKTDGAFEAGNPVKLFSKELNEAGFRQSRYCPSNDGQRFLLNVLLNASDPGRIVLVQNWAEEHKNK